MCVRGFTDTTTILQSPRFSADWAVRWTRTRGEEPGKSGSLEVIEVTDGVQPGGSVVSGANTPRLSILNATQQDLGFYTMELIPPPGTEHENDTLVEDTIRLMEDLGQPVFTEEPGARVVCASQLTGDNYIEIPTTVESSDSTEPIHHRWYVNGEHRRDGDCFNFGSSETPPFNVNICTLGTNSARLRIQGLSFYSGSGTTPRIPITVRCEAFNSHGIVSSREAQIVIDLSENDCDADGVTDACEIAAGAADMNANEVPDACECMTDIDGDGMTAGGDLATMLSNWGPIVPEALSILSDLDNDGAVGGSDLAVLLSNWGTCN